MSTNTALKGSASTIVYSPDYNVAYLFDYYGANGDISYEAPVQITNHFVESNVSVQDHMALPPVTGVISGFIGEIVYKPPAAIKNYLSNKTDEFTTGNFGFSVTDKLSPLAVLAPSVSSVTQNAINATQNIEASYNRYNKIYKNFRRAASGFSILYTNQQYVFSLLMNIRSSHKFVNVATPWGELKKYAISNVSLRQDINSAYTSRLEIAVQEWREVGVKFTKPDPSKFAGRLAVQNTSEANYGKTQGKEPLQSGLYKLTNAQDWGGTPARHNSSKSGGATGRW